MGDGVATPGRVRDPRRWLIEGAVDAILGHIEGAIVRGNVRDRVAECNGECDENDPCRHLEKGSGHGEFRGGSYRSMRRLNAGNGKEVQVHHMPHFAVSPWKSTTRDDWYYDRTPAIMMRTADHAETMTNGGGADKDLYRIYQADLLARGMPAAAFMNDRADVERIAEQFGRGDDYKQALDDAWAYEQCLEQTGQTGPAKSG